MWVIAFRKSLPRFGDDTNNRIERMFYTLKGALYYYYYYYYIYIFSVTYATWSSVKKTLIL